MNPWTDAGASEGMWSVFSLIFIKVPEMYRFLYTTLFRKFPTAVILHVLFFFSVLHPVFWGRKKTSILLLRWRSKSIPSGPWRISPRTPSASTTWAGRRSCWMDGTVRPEMFWKSPGKRGKEVLRRIIIYSGFCLTHESSILKLEYSETKVYRFEWSTEGAGQLTFWMDGQLLYRWDWMDLTFAECF